ncbi:hypothetical protein [Streptomyces sp. H39-C1]|uniref:hypothetical protein n=1 Tax=Streptomyces sp. H39-C1 TaxID=3004355 RepID=UPI0022AFDD4A|nr:hypothetical protein [Streptomyces sp. H39-C1]MCZ4098020.1 hypothetical protein [Streptomyces sp. H39-C1]
MSVIGQEAGIAHGSLRGYRQHTYRKVAATEACGCLQAARDANAQSGKPARARSSSAQRQWNGGLQGEGSSIVRPGRRPVPAGACPVNGCGGEAGNRASGQRRGWVRVQVTGSTEPTRYYCSGSCATVGIALAELRMKPLATPDIA